jgi:hypothetical protein
MDGNRKGSSDGSSLASMGAEARTTSFRPLDTVRIARLRGAVREHLRKAASGRLPRVGDVGTVVQVLDSSRGPSRYLIEAIDDEGSVVWEAEFDASELALANGHL